MTDGSGHIEEICEWQPSQQIIMKLHEFTPPLQRLASHFIEEWHFAAENDGTFVRRTLQLFPTQPATRPLLWLISLIFRRAIERHLAEIRKDAGVAKLER